MYLKNSFWDAVKPGSLVITDKWYGYDELSLFILYSLLLGYYHESHNYSKGDYGKVILILNIKQS